MDKPTSSFERRGNSTLMPPEPQMPSRRNSVTPLRKRTSSKMSLRSVHLSEVPLSPTSFGTPTFGSDNLEPRGRESKLSR